MLTRLLFKRCHSSVNAQEVLKFSALAAQWWQPSGPFKQLHLMNPVRVQYIRDLVAYRHTTNMQGLTVLDVGCGGGILAVSLARLGARVVGIDASAENVQAATTYCEGYVPELLESGQLSFQCVTAEDAAGLYDIVCAMEIVEHVANPQEFMASCAQLVKPNGSLVVSTINKTPLAYALTIVAAEQVLRMVPPQTHDYNKFVEPDRMREWMQAAQLQGVDDDWGLRGMLYEPLGGKWHISPSASPLTSQCNYIMAGVKSMDVQLSSSSQEPTTTS